MIAKLICWDRDRLSVINRMKLALTEYQISGVITNISFLKFILENKDFIKGHYDIHFIDNLFKDNSNKIFDKNEDDLETAAFVFSALMKSTKSNVTKSKTVFSSNAWREQLYD
jgi:acetyl/propionyl-CoA carboxylase alpha subunit